MNIDRHPRPINGAFLNNNKKNLEYQKKELLKTKSF